MVYTAMIAAFITGFASAIGGVAVGALISYRMFSGRSPLKAIGSGKNATPPKMDEEPSAPLRFERKL